MGLDIIIVLIALPVALVAAFVWYRRSLAGMKPGDAPPVPGARLTAEALHRLPSPQWRVVYEINTALGDIDHVVIGPPGVIAISTVVADRPDVDRLHETNSEAVYVAEAALVRGPVDELLRSVGMSCRLSSRIYWGTPQLDREPFERLVYGSHLVEGQRIAEWLDALARAPEQEPLADRHLTPLDQAAVDRAWQTVVVGIGRPDPVA